MQCNVRHKHRHKHKQKHKTSNISQDKTKEISSEYFSCFVFFHLFKLSCLIWFIHRFSPIPSVSNKRTVCSFPFLSFPTRIFVPIHIPKVFGSNVWPRSKASTSPNNLHKTIFSTFRTIHGAGHVIDRPDAIKI